MRNERRRRSGSRPKLTATLVRRLQTALDAALRGDLEAARAIYEGAQLPAIKREAARRAYSVSPETDALLAATGNASRYLDAVVEQRWRAWVDALEILRRAGWRAAEIRAVCHVLLGPPMEGQPPRWIALEMADGERLNHTASDVHGVEPTVWDARVRQVAEVDEVARALAVVVAEFWCDNDALERAITRLE